MLSVKFTNATAKKSCLKNNNNKNQGVALVATVHLAQKIGFAVLLSSPQRGSLRVFTPSPVTDEQKEGSRVLLLFCISGHFQVSWRLSSCHSVMLFPEREQSTPGVVSFLSELRGNAFLHNEALFLPDPPPHTHASFQELSKCRLPTPSQNPAPPVTGCHVLFHGATMQQVFLKQLPITPKISSASPSPSQSTGGNPSLSYNIPVGTTLQPRVNVTYLGRTQGKKL